MGFTSQTWRVQIENYEKYFLENYLTKLVHELRNNCIRLRPEFAGFYCIKKFLYLLSGQVENRHNFVYFYKPIVRVQCVLFPLNFRFHCNRECATNVYVINSRTEAAVHKREMLWDPSSARATTGERSTGRSCHLIFSIFSLGERSIVRSCHLAISFVIRIILCGNCRYIVIGDQLPLHCNRLTSTHF